MGEDDSIQEALTRCLRFIYHRPRTAGETRLRLIRWGYDKEIADRVVLRLETVGLIDDPLFASFYIEEMVRKGFGVIRVNSELRRKHLSPEVIEESMSSYPVEHEFERASDVARAKFDRFSVEDSESRRRKMVSYLRRKGYESGVAESVYRDLDLS